MPGIFIREGDSFEGALKKFKKQVKKQALSTKFANVRPTKSLL